MEQIDSLYSVLKIVGWVTLGIIGICIFTYLSRVFFDFLDEIPTILAKLVIKRKVFKYAKEQDIEFTNYYPRINFPRFKPPSTALKRKKGDDAITRVVIDIPTDHIFLYSLFFLKKRKLVYKFNYHRNVIGECLNKNYDNIIKRLNEAKREVEAKIFKDYDYYKNEQEILSYERDVNLYKNEKEKYYKDLEEHRTVIIKQKAKYDSLKKEYYVALRRWESWDDNMKDYTGRCPCCFDGGSFDRYVWHECSVCRGTGQLSNVDLRQTLDKPSKPIMPRPPNNPAAPVRPTLPVRRSLNLDEIQELLLQEVCAERGIELNPQKTLNVSVEFSR